MAEKALSSSEIAPDVCDKVALVCRGEQKKPVSFSSDGTPRERQALHAAIRVAYGDSHCPIESKPVIQMKNEQWDGVFVDLEEEDIIPNRAVLRIVGVAEVASKHACVQF